MLFLAFACWPCTVQETDETRENQDHQNGLGLVGVICLSQSHSAGDLYENTGRPLAAAFSPLIFDMHSSSCRNLGFCYVVSIDGEPGGWIESVPYSVLYIWATYCRHAIQVADR